MTVATDAPFLGHGGLIPVDPRSVLYVRRSGVTDDKRFASILSRAWFAMAEDHRKAIVKGRWTPAREFVAARFPNVGPIPVPGVRVAGPSDRWFRDLRKVGITRQAWCGGFGHYVSIWGAWVINEIPDDVLAAAFAEEFAATLLGHSLSMDRDENGKAVLKHGRLSDANDAEARRLCDEAGALIESWGIDPTIYPAWAGSRDLSLPEDAAL